MGELGESGKMKLRAEECENKSIKERSELRRTNRTVCHRLVAPLPSPPVEVRVVP